MRGMWRTIGIVTPINLMKFAASLAVSACEEEGSEVAALWLP